MHDKNTKVKCNFCGIVFGLVGIKTHQRMRTLDGKSFVCHTAYRAYQKLPKVCSVCRKMVPPHSLRDHQKQAHGLFDGCKCQLCNVELESFWLIRKQKKIATASSAICAKTLHLRLKMACKSILPECIRRKQSTIAVIDLRRARII
jgi:hypothetical protein